MSPPSRFLPPLKPYLAIGRLTFGEATRQPAYGWVVVLTLLFEMLSPALAVFGFHQDQSFLREFGLSTVFVSGALLLAFSITAVLGRDFDSSALQPILAKPVSRGGFLAARWVGLVAALLQACVLFTLALLLADRQGPSSHAGAAVDPPVLLGGGGGAIVGLLAAVLWALVRGRPVGSLLVKGLGAGLGVGFLLAACFDRGWRIQPPGVGFEPLLAKAALLAFLGLVILCSASVLVSVILRRGAFLGTLVVFVGSLALAGQWGSWGLLLPDLRLFWVGDVLYTVCPSLPAPLLVQAALYALSYSLFCLGLGAIVMGRREIP